MESLVAIVAILMVFGMPALVATRALRSRERRLELEAGSNKQVTALLEERNELRDRVAALEEVVLGGDFELNQQLKKIAREQAAEAKLRGDDVKALPIAK